jgi:hypothetical protein
LKPIAVIRLSKSFLIVAAILVLISGSSVVIIPVRAPSGSKIVYVAICVDSETTGFGGIGSTNPHPTLNVSTYSRTSPSTVAAVFDSNFRNSYRDSFANDVKLSWFAEMDYLMAQSNFVWADGSPAGVSGYTAIRDLLVNTWGTEIQTYGDSIEYHHHFMIYNETWQRYNGGPDAGYPGYQMYALDHMIIDRNFYSSTWRSGDWIMPPALSSWLEQWMPFDYTPTTGIWYPVHPSGMDRWQTNCPYAPNVLDSLNSAFAYARDNGSAIYSICTHDNEDMKSQVDWLQWCLNTVEATYPDVLFKYVSAREAIQLALGFTDFAPLTFTVTQNGGTYTIVSSETLWKNHPYIALKYADGTYGHMNATPAGSNTWTVTPLSSVSVIGVAGSDLYGNPGTQNAYSLTVSTVGSGSVTKSPDQAMYPSGTVVSLTAVSAAGWSFSGWSGDIVSSVNPVQVTMDGPKSVAATFTENQYTLTITVPSGGGSVGKSPDQATYTYGTIVTLTASLAVGWSFSGWSGDLGGSTSPTTITMDGNKAVTATFTQNVYSLTISYAGDGSGSVSTDLSAPYHYGDVVQLTATPADGSSFSGWSGDLGGSVNSTTITIDGNKAVTATFARIVYTLTIHTTGSGSVSTDKSAPYYWGDVVQLTASPATGWSFQYWGGDLSGSANITMITMKADHDITANFIDKPTLSMDPTSKICRMYGENFNVTITVSNAANVAGFAFEVHYNTTLLDCVGITWNVWSPGTITVDEVGGKITVSNSGTPTISGTQTLVTITFTASIHHIWKLVTGYTNDLTDAIYFQSISIGYASGPSLQYSRGDSTQINVGPDFAYTFSPIQGDIDNNGVVDILDFVTVALAFGSTLNDPTPPWNPVADINNDGTVDIFDLVVIAANFGYT